MKNVNLKVTNVWCGYILATWEIFWLIFNLLSPFNDFVRKVAKETKGI